MQIKFLNSTDDTSLTHRCSAVRKGDWIIYTCPVCEGYEIRHNLASGEFKRLNPHQSQFRHEGSFVPVGLENFSHSPN